MAKVGPYNILKKIGSGSSARVYLGVHKKTEQAVAIKAVKKKEILKKAGSISKVKREIAIQRLLHHPNIIELYDVYETSSSIFIVLEYVPNGDLFEYILLHGHLRRNVALKFFQQIVYAVEYCASVHVTHRDLKPENILLDEYMNIKLSDFGMAHVIEQGSYLQTSCGSPHYTAPEVISGMPYDGVKASVWSLGVILYTMLVGELPFNEETYQELAEVITRGIYRLPKRMSSLEKDIIRRMLVVNPDDRIELSAIKDHAYFRQNFPMGCQPPEPVPVVADKISFDRRGRPDRDIIDKIVQMQTDGTDKEAVRRKVLRDLKAPGENITKTFYILYKERSEEHRRNKKNLREDREPLLFYFKEYEDQGLDLGRVSRSLKLSLISILQSSYDSTPHDKLGSTNWSSRSMSAKVTDSLGSHMNSMQSIGTINDVWFENTDSRDESIDASTETHHGNTAGGGDGSPIYIGAEFIFLHTKHPHLKICGIIQGVLAELGAKVVWNHPDFRTFYVTHKGGLRIKIKIHPTALKKRGGGKNNATLGLPKGGTDRYSDWKPRRRPSTSVDDEEILSMKVRSQRKTGNKFSLKPSNALNTVKFVWLEGEASDYYNIVVRFLDALKE